MGGGVVTPGIVPPGYGSVFQAKQGVCGRITTVRTMRAGRKCFTCRFIPWAWLVLNRQPTE